MHRPIWPAALALVAAGLAARADETTTPDAYTIPRRTRHFKFTYHVEVQAPAGAKTVEVWLPVAHSSELQAVKLLAPEPERDPATGNEYRHTSLAGGATFTTDLVYDVARREHIRKDFRGRGAQPLSDR